MKRNSALRLGAVVVAFLWSAAFAPDAICQDNPVLSATADVGASSVQIEGIRLVVNGTKVTELSENSQSVLLPSSHFTVKCDVRFTSPNNDRNAYLVWTTIDFLVAETSEKYRTMSGSELSQAVSWGHISEMRDIKAEGIYNVTAGQQMTIKLASFDLSAVLASFPADQLLWPFLMRINVHVQDASGSQLGLAQKTFPIRPNSHRFRKG